jgi:Fe-S-cluster-containing dehydrogenase component
MACKVAHDLPADEWWQIVRTLGSGAGLDEPSGIYPNCFMEWMPTYTKKCILCADRAKDDLPPHCVHNCPAMALIFGDLDDSQSAISQRIAELRGKGFTIFQLPAWEQTRQNIYYANKH